MKVTDEKQRLRNELLELRKLETVHRHLADKQPEEYERINKKIKVVRRRMATLAYEERRKEDKNAKHTRK